MNRKYVKCGLKYCKKHFFSDSLGVTNSKYCSSECYQIDMALLYLGSSYVHVRKAIDIFNKHRRVLSCAVFDRKLTSKQLGKDLMEVLKTNPNQLLTMMSPPPYLDRVITNTERLRKTRNSK